jgi:hypothetical protein
MMTRTGRRPVIDGIAPSRLRSTAAAALPYAAVASLTLILGLPTFIMPLHPDQALFALVGRAVAAGGFPYVDAWDVKTPSVYFIYALAIQGPFDLMHNVRAFDLAWTMTTALLLIALGRRWWSLRVGVFAAAIYAVAAETGNPWAQSAQPDSFVALPLVLALLLYEAARGRWAWLAASGLVLGFAAQLRLQTLLLVPFVPLVDLLTVAPRRRVQLWARRMVWLAAGIGFFHLALLVYLAVGGALGEFVLALRYGAWYTRQGGPWNPPQGPTVTAWLNAARLNFWTWALSRVALTAPALAGAFGGAVLMRERRVAQLLLFTALTYAGIALQAKFFWYHFGPLVPLMALLGGWTWDLILRSARRSLGPIGAGLAAGALALLLVLGSTEVWDNAKRDWLNLVAYHRHPAERDVLLTPYSAFPTRRQVARYIRGHTQAGDAVYVWGFDPFTYLLSERPSASRFLVSFPLMSDWSPDPWRRSFLDELRARPPYYFIVQRGHAGSWITGRDLDMADALTSFPALQQWLEAGYELETEIEDRLMYRRRQ